MLKKYILVASIVSISCCTVLGPSYAQNTSTSAPIVKKLPIVFIPVDGGNRPAINRPVRGKITIHAVPSSNDQISSVVFHIAGKEVGRASTSPYCTDWDSTTMQDGPYPAKWTALSANGEQIESGSMTLMVSNSSQPPSTPRSTSNSANGNLVNSVNGSLSKKTNSPTTTNTTKSSSPQFVAYSSPKYDVKLEYPSDWTVKDQSSGVDKSWKNGYWLVFCTDPIDQAPYVVNLRYRLLAQSHSASSFVKFNPYLAKWQTTNINGRTVFITTTGTESSKRVTHRAMVLDGRKLWMLNCIDTTGSPSANSRAIFMKMLESLSTAEAINTNIEKTVQPAEDSVQPEKPSDTEPVMDATPRDNNGSGAASEDTPPEASQDEPSE